MVSKVQYEVTLALPKGDAYFGCYKMSFELSGLPTKPLFVDFRGAKIGAYTVNGVEIQQEDVFADHQIIMPTEHLKVGSNVIELNLWNKYRNDSCGLHSFVDPEDQEQYLYTQFEAEHCHWVFPCFE